MNASALLIILLSIVGLAVGLVVLFSVRRRSITRAAGAFDCSTGVGDDPRRPHWRLGVGVFTAAALQWYPIFSLRRRPVHSLDRQDLEIVTRRPPSAEEQYAVLPDAVIITCRSGAAHGEPRTFLFALDAEALAAFSSWLESAPPGYNLSIGRFT